MAAVAVPTAAMAAVLAAAPLHAQEIDYPFQQGVDYRIEATLDESTDVLHGRARLTYTNNSPDRLDTLFVHQHLNAFRPNSAWARRELEFDERRFQDLGPDEFAYERFTRVEIDGEAVEPYYPFAPDSTVAALPLPEPLAPGETTVVLMDWDARLATEPRRQGRRGRHFDFAQWYPRIAVYEPSGWKYHVLLPQGEFYGEFATYDITLDVREDQVIGATGVPVEGDPGWAAAAAPVVEAVRYGRDAYGDIGPAYRLGLLDPEAAPGHKRVRWHAENVHHFAWSTAPDYIYEQGSFEDVLIHVLYQPGDTAWDRGVAAHRTAIALEWLDTIFGDYPYRQLTNLHRIEGGGTEFPMMVMNGSASLGLIVHEGTHQYAHGILANNEWAEAWLDEGMASFVSRWFWEEHGREDIWRGTLARLTQTERRAETQPVGTAAADFVNYPMYSAMSYTKGSVVLYMLRELLGEDTFREVMRTYYDRYQFRHVSEEDLKGVAEDVSGRELDWFFQQWLHTTDTLDYAVADVSMESTDGGWTTRVEVAREGAAWMPVELRVGDELQTLDSRARTFTVTVRTDERPDVVALDPGFELWDMDRENNRWERAGV